MKHITVYTDESSHKNLTGQRFNRLQVLSFSHVKGRESYWICACDCGKVKTIRYNSLVYARTKSCGCLQIEIATKHGLAGKSYLYNLWEGIKARCLNPNNKDYHKYGGRGIEVDAHWANSFIAFRDYILANLGDRKAGESLDRIDNNKGYEPGNVRWASPIEQGANRRDNNLLTHNGKTLCMAEWSRELGIAVSTLKNRQYKNLSVEEILCPIRKRVRKVSTKSKI